MYELMLYMYLNILTEFGGLHGTNLSQYKIFYEVAKAGNISKAAKELYISQPAISKAISKLEDSLGAFSVSPAELPGSSA